jgi:molybdate transport system ATP-binding protein
MNVDWSSFPDSSSTFGDEMVRMENVDISYGSYLINRDINWTIRRGEKWALLGPNGSGKSTLLSYIFADHPQAYSKKLFLFGRKRGSGESIWDIKRGIGYTSSEMHLYYKQNISCLKVVASGFSIRSAFIGSVTIRRWLWRVMSCSCFISIIWPSNLFCAFRLVNSE